VTKPDSIRQGVIHQGSSEQLTTLIAEHFFLTSSRPLLY